MTKKTVEITTGRTGPKKKPIEQRRVLSDRPHKNRVGPPDAPMGATIGLDTLAADPPADFTEHERHCWEKVIVGPQRKLGKNSWIWGQDIGMVVGDLPSLRTMDGSVRRGERARGDDG